MSGATRTQAAQTGRYRRGVGVATGYWLYLWQPGSKVELAVKDGHLIASTAIQDIGTGSRTVIANTVAHEFGLEPHEIEVRIGDSNLPEGPGSGGSRTTASIVPPTLLAVQKLKTAIERNAKRPPIPGSNAPWRELLAASPDLTASAERPEDDKRMAPGIRSPLKDAGFIGMIFGWMMRRFSNIAVGGGVPSSVQVIEVEVDTWLGHVRVLNVHTGIAVGKIAAPALARSQAAGSVIQGIGYALYEAREIDPRTGDILTAGMEDYRIPGIADTPPIDVHFDEGGFDHVLGGSVGIGEVATVPTSPAIANAIYNATGIRPHRDPDPARPSDRRTQREGRRMTAASMTASAQLSEFRAAGTDLSERRRSGLSRGPLIDIAAAPGTIGIDWSADGAARIGAFTTIAAIAADARIAQAYPGLAASAQGLATPQIRHLATLGGNLAQRSRCWYYRNPQIACLKKGGTDCPARERQSSLRRRVRSRPLRRAASLDHGSRVAGL